MIRFTCILTLAVALGMAVADAHAVESSSKPRNAKLMKDHFSSPHRFLSPQQYAKLQQQRAQAARRARQVPTFTFYQPGSRGHHHGHRNHHGGGGGFWVPVPGQFQWFGGQMIYVPPHMQFVRNW